MNQKLNAGNIFLIAGLLTACAIASPVPIATMPTTKPPIFITFTPSPLPATTLPPAPSATATPEPAISPGCTMVNEKGQLFVLSNQEFSDLWSHERVIDQALAKNYPDWANYRQTVTWRVEPVKLSEILNSASFDNDLNLQINSTVTLVVLGMSLDWQLPANSDLFLKSRDLSLKLNGPALEWDTPGNEQIHLRFANISNSATYALYLFFNSDEAKLREFCNAYQRLFGTTQ